MRRTRPPFAWCAVLLALVAVSCVGTSSADVVARGPGDGRGSAPTTTTTIVAAARCAATLSPDQLAAQLLMVLVRDPSAASDAVAAGLVGGYALQGDQSAGFAGQVQAVAARVPGQIPLFVASDEEGGSVQRLRSLLGRYPAASTVATRQDPATAGAAFEAYAKRARALGVNMILGPVLDVGGGAGLGSRSFGDDPDLVTRYGRAVVAAIRRAGLVAVVKHWPGLGRGSGDPHVGPTRLPSIDELRARDLVPFVRLEHEGVAGVMVTHGTVDGLTGDVPASRSRAAIHEELRGRERFKGLVITDSLGMGAALGGTGQPKAAESSIAAGVDVAMVSGAPAAGPVHDRLVEAITDGRIPPQRVREAVAHVLAAKRVGTSCQVG
jgi:beta-N-acetylhexosaminidase